MKLRLIDVVGATYFDVADSCLKIPPLKIKSKGLTIWHCRLVFTFYPPAAALTRGGTASVKFCYNNISDFSVARLHRGTKHETVTFPKIHSALPRFPNFPGVPETFLRRFWEFPGVNFPRSAQSSPKVPRLTKFSDGFCRVVRIRRVFQEPSPEFFQCAEQIKSPFKLTK